MRRDLSAVVAFVVFCTVAPCAAQPPDASVAGGFDPTAVLSLPNEAAHADPKPSGLFPGLATSLRMDGATGAASTSIPIEVPPGRNGMTPQLSVDYSSNGGNGIFGVGWNFGLGQVRRSTRAGVPFEYDNNPDNPYSYPIPGDNIPGEGEFVFEMHGAQTRLDVYLGSPSSGIFAYGSYAEEAFLRVWFDTTNNKWIVTDKSGVQYTFGDVNGGSQSRMGGDVRFPKSTFAWGLTKIADPNGNTVTIAYATTGVANNLNRFLYPSTIQYGANSATGALNLFTVQLTYQARNDHAVSYLGGFEQKIEKRVQTVDVLNGSSRVRSYDFTYDNEAKTNVSRLTHVGMRGKSSATYATGVPVPGTDFTYAQAATGFGSAALWPVSPLLFLDDSVSYYFSGGTSADFMDLNGDGLADRIMTNDANTKAWCNSGAGLTSFSNPWNANVSVTGPNGAIMDLDGDGLPDQVVATSSNWIIAHNNGRG